MVVIKMLPYNCIPASMDFLLLPPLRVEIRKHEFQLPTLEGIQFDVFLKWHLVDQITESRFKIDLVICMLAYLGQIGNSTDPWKHSPIYGDQPPIPVWG